MEVKHYNITVEGYVQGVGFRYFVNKQAQICGVKGFVKNLYNGNVYIEVEGDDTRTTRFIRTCYQGPSHARVNNVEVETGELKNFTTFQVKF